ncbi:ankyrin repeat domain-containing protein 16-like [Watersipora subatra]|uniref:ankyrin repeat domain-containing protein 16-like n=1 Tax=Watersipora subatra TaxID=2589382 RepID=UPI00355C7876
MSLSRQSQSLVDAIKSNNLFSVSSLVESTPELCVSNSKVRKGDTPLHLAARIGNLDIVTYLLNHSAVNAVNNDGKTALHEASLEGRTKIVEVLLHHGADVNCLKAADWTPLMLAAAKSHLSTVQTLLKSGASLTQVNKDGWTAFHIAAREGDVEVLSCLLDSDEQCWSTRSKNDRTPLHSAVIHGRFEATQLLLSPPCAYNVDTRDSCGSSPLTDSLRKGFVSIAELLIKSGASFLITNTLGRNCYHIVAETGEVVSLQFLSQHTGNVKTYINQFDSRGTACLHLAAKEGHGVMIEELLRLGADPLLEDSKCRTAEEVAVLCGKTDCAEKLRSWSSQINHGT